MNQQPATIGDNSGELALFDPAQAQANMAKADALIQYAKKIKDWPLLEQAVEEKIKEQEQFVGWWEQTVTPNKGGDRKSEDQNSRSGNLVSATDAEAQTGIKPKTIHIWRRRLKEPDKYRAMLFGVTYHKAMEEAIDTTAGKWTGDPESYTPKKYIEAARQAMGAIDLDPASNETAQQIVSALEYYDEKSDGLNHDWHGRVFLNPPYKHPLVAQFIDKLCSEVESGNVSQAILLTNNNTDTKWWHAAAKQASAVCFTAGRINFYKPDGEITQPTNGQTFFYFGEDRDAFIRQFSTIGLVMTSVEMA